VRDVDVHCRNLDTDRAAALYDSLSDEERRRAAAFRFDRDRRWFVARRGFLREILGGYLNLDPAAVPFAQDDYGKPAVAGLQFSVSHSAGLALFAVSWRYKVGVDVEKIDPAREFNQVWERFFTSRETEALRALPKEQQTEAFFRCWTRKEAYVKARGVGLSLPLSGFDADGERIGDWSIESFTPAPGYIGAIVCGS